MAEFHADKASDAHMATVKGQLGDWFDAETVEKFRAAAPPQPAPQETPGGDESVGDEAGGATPAEAATRPPLEIRETFAVWSLSVDKIAEGLESGADLADGLAQPTGRWHHQITYNGKAVGFARSRSEAEARPGVCQLYTSALARHIDRAVRWLDDFEKKNSDYAAWNPLVRLLAIPSYQTHALWLVKEPPAGPGAEPGRRESDAFIIDCPSYLRPLQPQTMLSSRELLEALHKHEPLGGGLTFVSSDSFRSGG